MLRTLITLAAVAVITPALADTTVTFVDDSGQTASQMFIKGGKVRVQSSKGQGIMIYDSASNTMTMLMPEQKKYMVFDSKAAAEMGNTMSATQQQAQAGAAQAQAAMAPHQADMDKAQAEMQAKMANMSPQMQAAMQKMMANTAGHGMASLQNMGQMNMEVKDLGTTETVAGHSCQDEQIVMNGRPVSSLCVVSSPEAIGIGGADLATLKAMKDGLTKLAQQMGPMAQGMSTMMSKGFSIKSTHQSFDRATMKMTSTTESLKSVSGGGVDGGLFTVPSDYAKTSMDEMMSGAMGPHH